MQHFKIYSTEDAPSPADAQLKAVKEMLGFVPNVFAIIAESLPALRAFVELNNLFAESEFDATEREIIQTAASVENACAYCVAGHTGFAEMQKVPGEIIHAVRNNLPIADSKLEALNQFTRLLVRNRGNVSDKEVQQFLNAGYNRAHLLEVILGICVKTFSNLANNVIGIPLDDEFADHAWQPVMHDRAA